MVSTNELQERLQQWLRAHDLDRGVKWYTPAEWQSRREPYGQGAALSAVIECSPLCGLLNFDWAGWEGCDPQAEALYEQWAQFLERLGYTHELGFRWSLHIYPEADSNLPVLLPRGEVGGG